jgi:DNA-binding NarL/FixJ family response regulator
LKQIRVVVGEIPYILRAIVEGAVSLQADMKLISSGGGDLAGAVRRSAADVVIVAEESSEPADAPAAHRQVLIENPRLKMFVLTDDGREAHLLEFHRFPVKDISPHGLATAIRAAVGQGRAPARR